MNLALLFPLGLAALAAWLLPLLIHLRRRSEQQRTEFAALRWLPARARPRSRLRFKEWLLLLVRLLLLAAIALLLAEPVMHGAPRAERWTVVAPGVARASLPDSDGQGEYRWLAAGFPELDSPPPTDRQPVGSLLRELDATLPVDVPVTVIVPAQLDGADASPPVLHRKVEWRIIDGSAPAAKAMATRTPPRPALVVRHAPDRSEAVRYLRAAAIAWEVANGKPRERANAPDVATTQQRLPDPAQPLAWMAAGRLPDALLQWVERGGTALVDHDARVPGMPRDGVALWRDDSGAVLVRGLSRGRGRILQWSRPLAPATMPDVLEPEFPEQLWQLFAPSVLQPGRVAAVDYVPRTGAPAWPERPFDLRPWLLVLIAGLFVIERWLASGRREAIRP